MPLFVPVQPTDPSAAVALLTVPDVYVYRRMYGPGLDTHSLLTIAGPVSTPLYEFRAPPQG